MGNWMGWICDIDWEERNEDRLTLREDSGFSLWTEEKSFRRRFSRVLSSDPW